MREEINAVVDWLREHSRLGARLDLDTRVLRAGDVFVAVPGLTTDGRNFIKVAQARGAAAVIYEKRGAAPVTQLPALAVEDLRSKLGAIASGFYGDPSSEMTGIAVTGTNGKTTTTHWIAGILSASGRPCATIGTVGTHFGEESVEGPSLTTPDALSLQLMLRILRSKGASAFAIEASSVGLEQGRLSSAELRVGVYTNLSRDHLDYHKTMEAYARAKTHLFEARGMRSAVINADDALAGMMASAARDNGLEVWSFSLKGERPAWADRVLLGTALFKGARGMDLTIALDSQRATVSLSQIGAFNAENALAAAGAALAAGLGFEEVVRGLGSIEEPPGRMQTLFAPHAPCAVVDYCHTPDALEKVLVTLKALIAPGGRLKVVFGCGGDRDHGKRPMMAEAAARWADEVIVTSDNPRSEDPEAIIDEIMPGAPGAPRIVSRREAIHEAVESSGPADIVLVAGKGHEDYQEVRGVRHHFSDVECIREAFNNIYVREEK